MAESPEIPSPPEEAGTRAVREERCRRLITANWKSSHPRVCGENEGGEVGLLCEVRTIPACAGRTNGKQVEYGYGFGPSPRVRGERRLVGSWRMGVAGPSPRVRGEPEYTAFHWWLGPGHPRVCGEN